MVAAYLILMVTAFVLCVTVRKSDRSLTVMAMLLGASIITEALVYLAYWYNLRPQYYAIYHFYIPLEYGLLSYYFALHLDRRLAWRIYWTLLGITTGSSLVYSFLVSGLYAYPGTNLNIEGFILIGWSASALLTIRPEVNRSIFSFPVFWVAVGYLFYFAGGFFHNFIYSYLIVSKAQLAAQLNDIVNKGFNCLLYVCLSIAFLCSHRMKTST